MVDMFNDDPLAEGLTGANNNDDPLLGSSDNDPLLDGLDNDSLLDGLEESDDSSDTGISIDDIPSAAIVDFDEIMEIDEPEEQDDVNYDSEDLGSLDKYGLLRVKYGSDKIESYTRRINYIFGARRSLTKVGYLPLPMTQNMIFPDKEPDNLEERIESGDVEGLEDVSVKLDLKSYYSTLKSVYERANQLAVLPENVTQRMTEAVKRISELKLPDGAGSFFQLDVINIIRYLSNDSKNVSSYDVLGELRKRHPEQLSWFDTNGSSVLSYCENAISAYNETIIRAQTDAVSEKAKQLKNVRFILNDVNQLLADATILNQTSKLYFIRQVIVRGDKFYLKCPNCGEEINFTGPLMRCITVQKKDEHGVFLVSLPEIVKCTCGAGHILTRVDITKFELYLTSREQGALRALNDNAGILSPIYPISQFSISQKLNDIDQEINARYGRQKGSNTNIFLFEKDTTGQQLDADDTASETEVQNEEDNFTVITNSEFMKAVKAFRERLRMMDSPSDDEDEDDSELDDDPALMLEMQSYRKIKLLDEDARLSFKLMSALISVTISEDYQTIKNQALYSLISIFQENPLFLEVMDGNNLWNCKMLQFSIGRLLKKSEYNIEDRENALVCYNSLFEHKLKSVKDMTDEKIAEVVAYLPKLEEKYKTLQRNKDMLTDAIRKSKDTLAFTKIIKVTSVSLAALESIITSDELAVLFDEITDRMIITNFSDKFYDVFLMMSKTHATTLKGFENAVDANTAIAACEKYVTTKVKDDIRQHVATQPVAYEYFSLATDISSNTWEPCSKLNNYLHTCNVYGVISTINELNTVNSRQISTEFSKVFKESLEHVQGLIHEIPSNQHIYYLTDVGFSKSEIDEYIGSIDFHFNRYMLLREDNESLDSYLARLRDAINNGTLRSFPNKDYYDELKDYVCDLFILCSGVYFYSLESDKFIMSAFIISLINTYVRYVPQKLTLNKFGISDELFNLVRTNLYTIQYRPGHGRLAHELLDTNYISDLAALFAEWSDKYNEYIIHATDDLHDFSKFFDIGNTINECIDCLQDRVNSDSTLLVNRVINGNATKVPLESYDASDMLDELKAATSYYGLEVKI